MFEDWLKVGDVLTFTYTGGYETMIVLEIFNEHRMIVYYTWHDELVMHFESKINLEFDDDSLITKKSYWKRFDWKLI